MKLSEIQEEWTKDAKIVETDLAREALRIDELHSKYVKLYSNNRLALRKAQAEHARTRQTKRKYFLGQLSKEELKDLGWEQYLFAKPIAKELEEILEADEDLSKLVDRVAYHETVNATLESIMKSLGSRTFNVKNAITYIMYQDGNF